MSIARRVLTLCLLLGWLFAIGHVATEHGAMAAASVQVEHARHHDDAPEHDGDHHHDLTVLAAGHFAKAADHKALAPVWVPTCSALVERLAAMVREAEESRGALEYQDSSRDKREAGWLHVVQTALPVRGPSLA